MTLFLFDGWFVAASAICVGILMPLAIHARSIGYDAPGGVQMGDNFVEEKAVVAANAKAA